MNENNSCGEEYPFGRKRSAPAAANDKVTSKKSKSSQERSRHIHVNVMQGAVAVDYSKPRRHGFVARYSYKLEVPNSPYVADALVLHNGICVLTLKAFMHNATKLEFSEGLSTDRISGRLKKGASIINAGSGICTVSIADGGSFAQSIDIIAPVGGKILELNEKLRDEVDLIKGKLFDQNGYLAVLQPNCEIPHIDGPRDWAELTQHLKAKAAMRNICFAFQEGKCAKGSECRFQHERR